MHFFIVRLRSSFHLLLCTFLYLTLLQGVGCHTSTAAPITHSPGADSATTSSLQPLSVDFQPNQLAPPPRENELVATFAGGCFWCMEPPFDALEGVREAISGYTGGHEKNPTYAKVSSGSTSHTEAIHVYYDPNLVTYDKLLNTFWRRIDPTDSGGQFADRGPQYRPGIFVHSPEQRRAAEASRQDLEKSTRFSKPIIVPIEYAGDFWVAEEYHQNYYKKNHDAYYRYFVGSGRAPFLERVWGNEAK